MKPRFSIRQLFFWIGILAVLLSFGMYVVPNEITLAEVNQLVPGMTKDQVRAILGRPDGIDMTFALDGHPRECWRYGIYGWEIFFRDGRYDEAEQF